MNTHCQVIQDLLPLFVDGVCSADSRELIESHICECAECARLCEVMKDNTIIEIIKRQRK